MAGGRDSAQPFGQHEGAGPVIQRNGGDFRAQLDRPLKDLLKELRGGYDELNHYSFPFGLSELRESIADYTERLYGYRPDPDRQITVTVGATEAMSSTLRAVCSQGDGVLIMRSQDLARLLEVKDATDVVVSECTVAESSQRFEQ